MEEYLVSRKFKIIIKVILFTISIVIFFALLIADFIILLKYSR